MRRLTLEDARRVARERGFELLSDKYVNSKEPLLWKCSRGHEWNMSLNKVKDAGRGCPLCSTRKKHVRYTIELARQLARERGFELLTGVYKSTKTKMEWKCGNGHRWFVGLGDMKRGRGCPHCSRNARLTIEHARGVARERGFRLLSNVYVNAGAPMQWECENNHKWFTSVNKIKNLKTGCPHCAGRALLTIEHAREVASKRGFELLTDVYTNNRTKMLWKCPKAHLWLSTLNRIKNTRKGCPYCSEGKSERACRVAVESVFGRKFLKSYPGWLVNSRGHHLGLDGYCEELAVAFEYQGKQHYEFAPYIQKTRVVFDRQRDNDAQKRVLCAGHGVLLIEVPYTVEPADFERFVRDEHDRLLSESLTSEV